MADKNKSFFNKKARFDYEIKDSFEAGIVLTGLEIKAIKDGRVDMTGSYVKLINSELFWLGASILVSSGEGQRTRKLLVHKEQIKSLIGKVQEKGMTLVPLKLYLKHGKAKLEVGLGKGKKIYDKREALKKRDQEREAEVKIKSF